MGKRGERLLAAAVPLLLPKIAPVSPAAAAFDVDPKLAARCEVLLGAELKSSSLASFAACRAH